MGQNHRPVRTALPGTGTIKTVIISRNAYQWQYGGAERFSYNLARSLQSRGIRPVVVTRVPELIAHCRADGIATFRNLWLKNETRRRWLPAYYLLFPLLVAQYLYVIWRYRADTLLLGSRDDQIFGTIAASWLKRPVIWMDHADMKGIVATPLRFLGASYFWALGRAQRVVAVSNSERQLIFKRLPQRFQDKFVVITNGATRHPVTPMKRPAKDSFVITYIGRIEHDKGIDDLLEAARSICRDHPRAYFWIGGKGEGEASARERLKAWGLTERIILLGHLNDVSAALDASDLFVYPSHHDASPLAPAEALLAGLPVIATNVGGIPEVIDDSCGILVDKQSPGQLAEAITRLMTDTQLYRRLKQGAAKKASSVDFDQIVEHRYLPLFKEVSGG